MINIRKSAIKDIKTMVLLSEQKRSEYAEAQPQFWKKANEIQEKWFEELLKCKDYFLYVAEEEIFQILGFIIGRIVPAPEVYSPGDMTMMIDDFA